MIDSVTATLLGALVGALASLGTTLLTNVFTLRKERVARLDQQTISSQAWHRDQLQLALMSATAEINRYITYLLRFNGDMNEAERDPSVISMNSEVMKWVICILLHYPDDTAPEYCDLLASTKKGRETAILRQDEAWQIRGLLIDIVLKIQGAGAIKPRQLAPTQDRH